MSHRNYGPTASPEKPPGGLTPSQTVGPFFHYVMTPHSYRTRRVFSHDLTSEGLVGERIRIEGRVLDGDGAPMPDAVIEIWQADSDGRYAHPEDRRPRASNAFRGFGRCDTDKDGAYRFVTVKPGRVPGPDGKSQAPHVAIIVMARGMLMHLVTRIYFDGDPSNKDDAILALAPADRRKTLMATKDAKDSSLWRFDIRLQGEGETVFFDV